MMKTYIAPDDRFLRLTDVLKRLAISRSSFYAGIKNGLFPAPKKLGARTAVWLESDITGFIQNFDKSE